MDIEVNDTKTYYTEVIAAGMLFLGAYYYRNGKKFVGGGLLAGAGIVLVDKYLLSNQLANAGNIVVENVSKEVFLTNIENYVLATYPGDVNAKAVACIAALESNYGKSRLAKNWNALFGIKCTAAKQGTAGCSTNQYDSQEGSNDTYRAYNTLEESVDDFIKLANNGRYKDCLTQQSIYDVAECLRSAGYSTTQDYASRVQSIADQYFS
jgi:flagellum-specific peptidoglycan hydrolase FlgJ